MFKKKKKKETTTPEFNEEDYVDEVDETSDEFEDQFEEGDSDEEEEEQRQNKKTPTKPTKKKLEPKEMTVVVKELPVQQIRRARAEDGTIVNYITVEEALTKFINEE